MTETALIMPTKHDKARLFIISANHLDDAKVSGVMVSNYSGCEKPPNIPHGWH